MRRAASMPPEVAALVALRPRGAPPCALRPLALAVVACLATLPAAAQDATDARTVSLTVGAAIGITATDNQLLTSTQPKAEAIVQPSVSLGLNSRTGRLTGFLSYTAAGQIYSRDTADNEVQNTLNAFGTAELVEGWGFVDVGASVSQQSRSVFGVLGPEPALGGSNRTEVTTLRLAPRVRGRLGNAATYDASLARSATRSSPDAAGDSYATNGLIRVAGTPGARLGLSAELVGNIYNSSAGRRTAEALLRGVASWSLDSDLTVSLVAGRETNNFSTVRREGSALWGARAIWQPSPRTTLSLDAEHRELGTTHAVTLSHRFARSAILFSDSRAVTAPENRAARGSLGTAYDLLFLQYASIEPDPARRQQLVQAALAANGLDPNQPILADFLTSSATLDRTQDLALSWIGVRDTVTLGFSSSNRRRIDTLAVPVTGDDFASTDSIRQRGLRVNVAHRLTPTATVTLFADAQRTRGDLASQRTTLRSYGVGWSDRIGLRSDLSLGAKHATFDSPAQPYEANTATAVLRFQF